MAFADAYRSKRVFITGHTGFKGSWLTQWLINLGAQVTGYALKADSDRAMFCKLNLSASINHIEGDIRDLDKLRLSIREARPDIVLHLAAQPLVRLSFENPLDTYSINIMGTVNLLEAIRLEGRPCAVVVVTTDKCYDNKEWVQGYREEDSLGGFDPYSSSKAATEIVSAAYRSSFFRSERMGIKLATARAGNVIGGGDWAADRIVPDCVRSLLNNKTIGVRNKISTRPWQHVLEPLSGYLWLGASLLNPKLVIWGERIETAFNFGPELSSNRTVAQLVEEILKHWEGRWEDKSNPTAVHEAKLLNLSSDKAFHLLGWKPTWDFEKAVKETVEWYKAESDGTFLTSKQITDYSKQASDQLIQWAL